QNKANSISSIPSMQQILPHASRGAGPVAASAASPLPKPTERSQLFGQNEAREDLSAKSVNENFNLSRAACQISERANGAGMAAATRKICKTKPTEFLSTKSMNEDFERSPSTHQMQMGRANRARMPAARKFLWTFSWTTFCALSCALAFAPHPA